MPNKAKQQRQNVKARKAKSRDKAKAEYGTWKNRNKSSSSGLSIRRSPALSMMDTVSRMFPPRMTQEERDRQERTLCSLFGEEYKPRSEYKNEPLHYLPNLEFDQAMLPIALLSSDTKNIERTAEIIEHCKKKVAESFNLSSLPLLR